MAFDRKDISSRGLGTQEQERDQKELDPLKELINNETADDEMGEEAENEQKRKEAMTERD